MTDRVSLEEAKRIKEAGFEQDGCDMYFNVWCKDSLHQKERDVVRVSSAKSKTGENYAMPCACGILAKLPKVIKKKRYEHCIIDQELIIRFVKASESSFNAMVEYICIEHEPYEEDLLVRFENESLVSALTDMYCWLAAEELL